MAIEEGPVQRPRLKLLLDSNIVVAAEPFAGAMEANVGLATTLLRLAGEQGHLLCVAPATRDDVLENLDSARGNQRVVELQKFHQLEEVPVTGAFRQRAGDSRLGSNDHRDLRLLATVDAGAVDYLVTEDRRLRRRAVRAGLQDLVIGLPEAVELLRGFEPPATLTPPRVERCATYALDPEQPIFDSLREDYPEFDAWLTKVRRDHENRTCLLIREDGVYGAIALLKSEPDCEYNLPAPVTKISTFKVGAEFGRVKYGELLLKAIFADAEERPTASLYVEVLPKHDVLVTMLSEFGFLDCGHRTRRDELVLVKHRVPAADDVDQLDDLEYHVRFGPPALLMRQSAYLVPIQPRWHDQLFPERIRRPAVEQMPLFDITDRPLTHPWGNALRKAYLCNSPTSTIGAGDVLAFYRSTDARSVSAIGIVDDAIRSTDAEQVAAFVGQRTVYTLDEIAAMSRSVRGVLAIRFRQDRFINPEIPLADLRGAGVVNGWPQSITRVPEGSMAWLRATVIG